MKHVYKDILRHLTNVHLHDLH